MLYWLIAQLESMHHGFQVFHYLSLRAILASMTALFFSLLLGPVMIRGLQRYQVGQVVRDDGPATHHKKAGTPTMGGILILSMIIISTLLWANLSNQYVWLVVLVSLGFGVIGWWDDHLKIVLKSTKGLSAKWKLMFQSILALAAGLFLFFTAKHPYETALLVPFMKHSFIYLGWFFVVLCFFVIVGSSNAVNLTDGLDGLAILPVVLIAGALGVFAYLTGNSHFASYLSIPYIQGSGEIVIFCGALVGAGLGFLWFNTYPAQIFMGDVGALGLGAALAIVAIIVRQELVFFVMSGVFVLETVSVMLQVTSFRLRGKRIFKMAPIHHHFELKGWAEPKVIVRFWIITFVLVLCGLATLKIR